MNGRWILFAAGLIVLGLVGCGSSKGGTGGSSGTTGTTGTSGASCVPGASAACTCTDGRAGAQVCQADGKSFTACQCQGSTASSGSTGSGSSSGASSSGSSSSSTGASTTGSASGSTSSGSSGSGASSGSGSTSGGTTGGVDAGSPPRCTLLLPSVPGIDTFDGQVVSAGIGDVNGDGLPDVVGVTFPSTGWGASAVVAFGRGDGTFFPVVNPKISTSDLLGTSIVTDLNRDGVPDVLIGDWNGLDIFLGLPDGGFADGGYTQTGISTSSAVGELDALAAADLNGDGIPDALETDFDVQGSGSGYGESFLALDGGGFLSPGVTFGGGNGNPIALGAADLNGDGMTDVVLVMGRSAYNSSTQTASSTVQVLLGHGNGSFAAATPYTVPGIANALALGDLNGDGRTDLAVASGGTVSVLLGVGDGTFQNGVSYPAGWSSLYSYNAQSIAIADVNHDGHADLLVTDYEWDNLAVLYGRGDGTFLAPVYLPAAPSPFAQGGGLAVGDLNRDGVADVVNANQYDLGVLLGAGPALSEEQLAVSDGGTNCGQTSLLLADVNGDGRLDALAGACGDVGEPRAFTALGRADGGFGPAFVAIDGGTSFRPSHRYLAVGDFNGDGKPDAVIENASFGINEAAQVVLGVGDGTFARSATWVDGGCASAVAADLNGDGALDLACTAPAINTVWVALGLGDGGALPATALPQSGTPEVLTRGDFNNDGFLDLAFTDSTHNQVGVLLGNGDGTFQAALTSGVGTQPNGLVTGDFDGDGKLDLAVSNGGGRTVTVLMGRGTGTFLVGANYPAGGPPYSITAADLDGDGHLDLLVGEQAKEMSVLFGVGDGGFWPPVHYGGAWNAAVGDLNGDGRPDVAVLADHANVDLTVIQNNGCR